MNIISLLVKAYLSCTLKVIHQNHQDNQLHHYISLQVEYIARSCDIGTCQMDIVVASLARLEYN